MPEIVLPPPRAEKFSERLLAHVTPSMAERFRRYAAQVRASREGERVTDGEVVRHLVTIGLDHVEQARNDTSPLGR